MKFLIGLFLVVGSSTISFSQTREVTSTTLPADSKPLIVLDGKVLPKSVKSKTDSTQWVDPLEELDPNKIDRIDVIKDDKAVALYGDSAKNGVILITTKGSKKD